MAKQAEEVKTLDQLHEELATKRKDLREATRAHVAGELANPRVKTTLRKDIARLLTAINAVEDEQEESK